MNVSVNKRDCLGPPNCPDMDREQNKGSDRPNINSLTSLEFFIVERNDSGEAAINNPYGWPRERRVAARCWRESREKSGESSPAFWERWAAD